jgi:hypothetical protein
VAGILLPSPVLEEGLGVRVINYLCHYFRKMVLQQWGEGSGFFKWDWELIMLLKTDSV